MDDQTKADNPKSTQQSASRGFATGAGNVVHDVLTLAELQAQLFAIDVRECRARMTVPVLLLLGGFAIALACFPIGLAALALCLIEFFNTTYRHRIFDRVHCGSHFGHSDEHHWLASDRQTHGCPETFAA